MSRGGIEVAHRCVVGVGSGWSRGRTGVSRGRTGVGSGYVKVSVVGGAFAEGEVGFG